MTSNPLQETIRRVLKEDKRLNPIILRRVRHNDLEREFSESLISARDMFSYSENRGQTMTRTQFTNGVVSRMVDGIHYEIHSTMPEDSQWYDNVYDSLKDYYKDRIDDYYNHLIGKTLNEETLKDSLTDLIKTDGIERASKTVGGFKRLSKILELDVDNIDTQEKLVKDFIYHDNTEGVEVAFIEVRTGRSGGKIIDVHIRQYFDGVVGNLTSWYVNEMLDKIRKVFPFQIGASWHPVFTSTKPRISLDCHVVKDEVEDLTESKQKGPRELPNELKRRAQRLDDLISKVVKDTEMCEYKTPHEFINIVVDELLWELRDDYHGDLSKLDRFDVTQYVYDFKYHELEDYYLESCQ
jgi:hypothetical protein